MYTKMVTVCHRPTFYIEIEFILELYSILFDIEIFVEFIVILVSKVKQKR